MTDLKTTTRAEWNTIKDSGAPWSDFETEYYMQNVPTSWILGYDYDHFKALMEGRDSAMQGMFVYIIVLITANLFCSKHLKLSSHPNLLT